MTVPSMQPLPLREQIACVKRELAIRGNVYPRQIARNQVHPATAAVELQRMQSVLRTLEQLEREKGPDWVPERVAA